MQTNTYLFCYKTTIIVEDPDKLTHTLYRIRDQKKQLYTHDSTFFKLNEARKLAVT